MAQTVDPSSIRVALLAGGTSGEREISLASGEGAGEALRAAGFIVEAFDPASRRNLSMETSTLRFSVFTARGERTGASKVS